MLTAHPLARSSRPGSVAPTTADAGALGRRRLAAFLVHWPAGRQQASQQHLTRARAREAGAEILDHHSQPCLFQLLHRARPSGPAGDAARATTRHPVLRASTPTVLHRSAAGAAAPALQPRAARDLARALRDRRSSRLASRRLPAVPAWQRRSGLRIRQGPSMYEMEGPCPASPRQAGQLAGLARHRAPPAGAGYPREETGLPAPPAFPGPAPGGARFQR